LKLGKIDADTIVFHSSFRYLKNTFNEPSEVVAMLCGGFDTVMMPAFCWLSNAAPPLDDRPSDNGCDYGFYSNFDETPKPFLVETAGIEPSMGTVAKAFLDLKGVYRSNHAWHSWAAYGKRAEEFTANDDWNVANIPLKRAANAGAWVVLAGVDLRSCTALHIAEELAGGEPFVRWAWDRDGVKRRVAASGCGKGFQRLWPHLSHLFVDSEIGGCGIIAAPLEKLILEAAEVIKKMPDITICSTECIRCQNMLKRRGGVVDGWML
jgi:aminoglycoside N3'-acetyltransferase